MYRRAIKDRDGMGKLSKVLFEMNDDVKLIIGLQVTIEVQIDIRR